MVERLRWEARMARERWSVRAGMAVAWRLPRWLVRWATVRCFAHATTGRWENTIAPNLTFAEALQRWDER